MNLSYKYLHFYIMSIVACIPVWVLHLSLMLIYFKLMCGSFLKPLPCLLNAFFVFSVSLRDLQIAATPEAVCRYLGR